MKHQLAGAFNILSTIDLCRAVPCRAVPLQNKDIYRRATRVGTLKFVSPRISHYACCSPLVQQDNCMLISRTANKHAVLAGCSAFWPDTHKLCIKKGDTLSHSVALLHISQFCGAVLCFALLCFALLCFALLCFALLCFALLCFVVLCFALLCFALLCFALLCFALLCCALLKILDIIPLELEQMDQQKRRQSRHQEKWNIYMKRKYMKYMKRILFSRWSRYFAPACGRELHDACQISDLAKTTFTGPTSYCRRDCRNPQLRKTWQMDIFWKSGVRQEPFSLLYYGFTSFGVFLLIFSQSFMLDAHQGIF